MPTTTQRKIVKIDEDKCDGCGLCVPSCAEGAIQIVDGKARLVADNLCDGLGNCLGDCPREAITIEEREANAFDETAVERHQEQQKPPPAACPGMRMRKLTPPTDTKGQAADTPSQLGHWPVQLALVPVTGEMWQDADVLIAADCVPFATADFHGRLLAGKRLAVGCPKLDDLDWHTEKLTEIFASNEIRSVTVAHMEVPCCFGILHAVQQALDAAGKPDVPLHEVEVGVDGRPTPKS